MPSSLRDLFSSLRDPREPLRPSTLSFALVDVPRLRNSLTELERTDGPLGRSVVQRALEPLERKAREDFGRQRDIYQSRIRTASTIGHLRLRAEAACKNVVADFKAQVHNDLGLLHTVEHEVVTRAQSYDDFRRSNGLTRPHRATYGQSHALKILTVVVLVVCESIGNGLFFAQGSDQGWIGGIAIAFGFSLVNVASAAAATYFLWRWTALQALWQRSTAYVLLAAAWVWIGVLNLAIGHYRDTFRATGGMSFDDLLAQLATAPASFSDVTSVLLVFLGLAVAVMVSLEVAHSADQYPGYSRVANERDRATDRYTEERSRCLADLQELRDGAIDDLEGAISGIRDAVHEVGLAQEGLSRLYADYRRYRKHLREVYVGLREGDDNTALDRSPFGSEAEQVVPDEADEVPPGPAAEDAQLTLSTLQACVAEINDAYSSSVPQYKSVDLLMPPSGQVHEAAA